MYARKVAPGKIFNPAKNGAIFVRRVKPIGKVLRWFKGVCVPPTAVVAVGAVIVVASIGYGTYKAVKCTGRKSG